MVPLRRDSAGEDSAGEDSAGEDSTGEDASGPGEDASGTGGTAQDLLAEMAALGRPGKAGPAAHRRITVIDPSALRRLAGPDP